jgi:N-acetyl-gamma-glutamyl-phosphate reductase
MIKVAVVGATGYTGEELVELLLNHPKVKLSSLTALVEKEIKFSHHFKRFTGKCDLICKNLDAEEVARDSDLVFLALPHGVSMEYAPVFLKKGKRVIDLSADYRLKDPALYKQWYKTEHKDKENLEKSVYGLPEIYQEEIKDAQLIANPGCYPTVSLLCCLPLTSLINFKESGIIIDAKSGVTGAGRKASLNLHFAEVNENMKAYKINSHQHIPEITQELSGVTQGKVNLIFTPHIVPLNRGILATCYIQHKGRAKEADIIKTYKDFYAQAPFVKVLDKGQLPEIKDVAGTNFCQIGIDADEEKGLIVIVGAIDNLLKGASGQALENMNIMYGFDQREGLS